MLFGSQTNPWKTSVCVCDEFVKEGWDVDSVQMPGSVEDKTLQFGGVFLSSRAGISYSYQGQRSMCNETDKYVLLYDFAAQSQILHEVMILFKHQLLVGGQTLVLNQLVHDRSECHNLKQSFRNILIIK